MNLKQRAGQNNTFVLEASLERRFWSNSIGRALPTLSDCTLGPRVFGRILIRSGIWGAAETIVGSEY